MYYNFTHRGTVGGGDAPSVDNGGEYFKPRRAVSR